MEKLLYDMHEKCEKLEELLANERSIRAEKEEIIEEQTEAIEEMTEEAQQINTMRINLVKYIKLMEDLAFYLVNSILKDDNSFDHSKILEPFSAIQKNDNINKLNQSITEIGDSFSNILSNLKEFTEIKKIERLNSNSQVSLNKSNSVINQSTSLPSSKKNSVTDINPNEIKSEPIQTKVENKTTNSIKESENSNVVDNESIEKLKEANILLRNKLTDQQLIRDKLLEGIENIKQEAIQKSSALNTNYEKAMSDIKKEQFKNNEYVSHMATMQEELTRLMNENENLNKRQQQLEMDLEKMITDNLSMKSNTKSLKADKQVLMSKLSHELHINDLLSSEVDSLPDYIMLYHKERKALIEQNKKLVEKVKLLKEGKEVSMDDIKEYTTSDDLPGNFIKFDSGSNLKDSINTPTLNNDKIDQLSIINNSDISYQEEDEENQDNKPIDIFEKMDNIINDNVYDFTACRYCSSNLITL